MKRNIGTLILILAGLLTQAQDDEMKTIISGGTQINGFGSVDMKYTNLVERPAFLVGAQGGILLNHHFYIGGAGYGIASSVEFENQQDNSSYKLYGGYAGVVLGGVIAPSSIVHLYVPILLGAGNFDVTDPSYLLGGVPNEVTIESSAFFVAEPGLQVEVNVTQFFRLGIGGSWRFVEAEEFTVLDSETLSGWSTEVSFRFGRF
jgi:hypothetical protein